MPSRDKFFRDFQEFVGRRLAIGEKRRLQGRGDDQLELAAADLRIGVFRGDDLALLGHADLAVHRARRLRQDRVIGRSAAAPDRSAAPVEEAHREVREGREEFGERGRGAIELPDARDDSAVLVAVGIAEHDVLRRAGIGDERGDPRQRIEIAHDRRGVAQVFDRLEERRDDQIHGSRGDILRGERAVHQAAFLLQEQHLQQIAHRLRVRNDVMADRFVAEARRMRTAVSKISSSERVASE